MCRGLAASYGSGLEKDQNCYNSFGIVISRIIYSRQFWTSCKGLFSCCAHLWRSWWLGHWLYSDLETNQKKRSWTKSVHLSFASPSWGGAGAVYFGDHHLNRANLKEGIIIGHQGRKVYPDNNHLPLLFIVLPVCQLLPEGKQALAVGAPWPCKYLTISQYNYSKSFTAILYRYLYNYSTMEHRTSQL